MEITANKDLGFKETFDKWNGKWLDETSYDTVVSSIGVKDDIIKVYKPSGSLFDKPILACIVKNAYTGDTYQQVKDTRSNIGYSNVDAILDGDITKVIEDVLISQSS